MKLFYYDKFLESYANLPKQTQKKVMDFVQKFKLDSKSAAIHLEPIISFKDPQLRTARIDQKYRAVLHVSTTNEIYHLLWVDNHDEAMRWAENKIFEWNKNTQAYQVYEYKETKTVPSEKDTKKEKIRFCENFTDEDLLKIGVPFPLLGSVRDVDTFDDLELLEKYLPREAFENLYYLLDGSRIEDIISEIEEGIVSSTDFHNQLDSANNKRNFFEVKDDKDIEELLSGDLSKWKIFLHPSQRILSEKNFSGSYKVSGAAGTGKTVLALHRLKYILGHTSKPKSIFFTTFTKSLVNNLKDALISLSIDLNKIIFTNIHNFIVERAKELKLIEDDARIIDFMNRDQKNQIWREIIEQKLSEFDSDFLMREFEEVVLFNDIKDADQYLKIPRIGMDTPLGRKDRVKVWELIETFKHNKSVRKIYYLDEVTNLLSSYCKDHSQKPFDHIIADEIQDFSDVELRLLRCMVPEKENDLFLVGDPLQNIYNRKLNFSRSGINIRGAKSKRLKVNYRTTEEIKRSATAVIRSESFDNFDGEEESKSGYLSILHGEKPAYRLFDTSDKMNEYIIETISNIQKEAGFEFKEFCVASRTKNSLSEIKKYFHSNNIPYYDLVNASGHREGVTLSTFHNMKGLEYKVVILYDVSNTTVPNIYFGFDALSESEKKSYLKSEKALLYVSMTRAIGRLLILGCGAKTDLIKI